jgi:hypothetical protein
MKRETIMTTSTDYTFRVIAVIDRGTPFTKRVETQYKSAIEAVRAYDSYVDFGFASYQLEVDMIEPNGNVTSKVFKTEGARFAERTIRYQLA